MELRVEKLCKSFGAKQVLKEVSFTTSSGDASPHPPGMLWAIWGAMEPERLLLYAYLQIYSGRIVDRCF